MFGWRLYLKFDYCFPGMCAVEFMPFSWKAVQRVWREMKAAREGKSFFCDAVPLIAKEPKPFVLFFEH